MVSSYELGCILSALTGLTSCCNRKTLSIVATLVEVLTIGRDRSLAGIWPENSTVNI